MNWLISHNKEKIINLAHCEMIFMHDEGEEEDEERYCIIARSKHYKAYLYTSPDKLSCKAVFKDLVDNMHEGNEVFLTFMPDPIIDEE